MSSIKQTTIVLAENLTVGTILADGEFRRIETIIDLRKNADGVRFITDASQSCGAGEYFYPNGRRVAVRVPR